MTKSTKSRAAVAALLAAAAMASGAPAQADPGGGKYDCEGGEERLLTEFREIEAKHGWDKATQWWHKAWERYYESCRV